MKRSISLLCFLHFLRNIFLLFLSLASSSYVEALLDADGEAKELVLAALRQRNGIERVRLRQSFADEPRDAIEVARGMQGAPHAGTDHVCDRERADEQQVAKRGKVVWQRGRQLPHVHRIRQQLLLQLFPAPPPPPPPREKRKKGTG